MNTMSEKRGYKYTEEFGFIPDDWGYLPLQELVQSMRLGGNYSNTLIENDLPLIKMGNIDRGKIILDKIEYVADKNIIIADKLIYGDFLFNTRNTPDLVGKVAVWKNELKNAYYNSNLLNIKFKKKLISSNFFINYIFNTPQMMLQLKNIATGTTSVAAIYSRDLLQLCIPVPSLPEQIKIAEVLGDIDSLIDKTQQLIDKKKNLKIATMQKLLTQKEGWVTKKFKEIAEMNSGGTPISSNKLYYGGNIPFLSINDLTTQGKYLRKTEKRITTLGLNNSSARMVRKGDLLYAMYATLGKCSIACIDVAISQAVLGISVNSKIIINEYLFYYLTYIENDVKTIGQTGTQSNLSKKLVSEIEIFFPSISEQQKIASILSDMDFEIESLEKEMEKYIDLKIGMMQQLLTGKVRLV